MPTTLRGSGRRPLSRESAEDEGEYESVRRRTMTVGAWCLFREGYDDELEADYGLPIVTGRYISN